MSPFARSAVTLVFCILMLIAIFFLWPVHANPYIRVVDGDTVQLPAHRENTRLVGLDAPEIFNPDCPFEKSLGRLATRELQTLTSAPHNVTYTPYPCTGWNYGRTCAILYSDGVDIARTLIGMNLAIPYNCTASRCPKRPHPSVWCTNG